MSHSTILIPSDSVRESVGSSPSLAILSDTKAEVMTIPIILSEIAPEAAALVIVSLLTATPDPIESDPEVKPSKASSSETPPSPDYPMEDEFEPIEDAPETSEPLPAKVAPPVYNTPTLPISSVEPTPVIPYDTRATVTMLVHPQPSLPLCYRAAIARWSAAPSSTPYPSCTLEDSVSQSGSLSAAPSVPR
ncbi:hypothetical protein Tco_1494998, partial [Tanacetum coccineum]